MNKFEQQDKTLFISGGSGWIGQALVQAWLQRSQHHRVVIQTRNLPTGQPANNAIRYVRQYAELGGDRVDAVVNLAGAPIADARWTTTRRQLLEHSRIAWTQALVDDIAAAEHPPKVMISASAIGYYGFANARVDESAVCGQGYAAQLCQRWEAAAQPVSSSSRLVLARLAVVLGPGAAVLKKLLPVFKLGLGGPLGSGSQWLSWVHLHDVLAFILRAIDDERLEGVYNVSAPDAVQQKIFASNLANCLRRPARVPTPALILRVVFGQMAEELLLGGQRVVPQRLLAAGFDFRYPQLPQALAASIV